MPMTTKTKEIGFMTKSNSIEEFKSTQTFEDRVGFGFGSGFKTTPVQFKESD